MTDKSNMGDCGINEIQLVNSLLKPSRQEQQKITRKKKFHESQMMRDSSDSYFNLNRSKL